MFFIHANHQILTMDYFETARILQGRRHLPMRRNKVLDNAAIIAAIRLIHFRDRGMQASYQLVP